jgi:putative addiction module antidote
MKQKIIKIGNSAGIILPKKLQTELGLKLGDTVAMEYNTGSKFAILAKEEEKRLSSKNIPELDDWLKKFNAKYKTALAELSKK